MKKRIGIITYHKAYNFGSVLQAYALNKYLRDLGHDVETIDFQTEKQAQLYKLFEPMNSLFSIARNLQSLRFLRRLRLQRKRFDDFLREFIPTSEDVYVSFSDLNNAELNYDVYICGSDQIWNLIVRILTRPICCRLSKTRPNVLLMHLVLHHTISIRSITAYLENN